MKSDIFPREILQEERAKLSFGKALKRRRFLD
jgi:hypothetical protein